jgi:hypothetical protein
VIQGKKVEQYPSVLSVHEGNHSVINCNYSDSGSYYFSWYKQEPGKGPQLIIDIHSNQDTNSKDRLMVLLNKKDKHFSLHISGTWPGDSAIYFCAASTHCFPGTCNLSSNLTLKLQPYPCPLPLTISYSIWQLFFCKWQLSHRH